MHRIVSRLTRVLGAISVCVLLWPGLASASEVLTVDFDGDGRHDLVTLSHRAPSVLRVWLSASHATEILHAPAPFLRVVAADLDGDRRPELIAWDSDSRA